ncbi:MAG: hypothetical protein HUJ95_06550 [Bacteroidales bacterium]|nr:hypothetical protein [Bacteroidales bacterium]
MNKKTLLAILILGFCTISAGAWDDDNPWRNSLWSGTGNASGLSFKPVNKYHRLKLGGVYEQGAFNLIQEGTGFKGVDFTAEGTANIKKVFLWGRFDFSNTFRDGANYNVMLFNPRPEMPFYVADVNSSNWRYQTYNLAAKAAFPLGEAFALGIDAGYDCGFGAKQVDPRTATYIRNIHVGPSFTFKWKEKNILGVNIAYTNNFERSTPTLSNINIQQTVALMRGLGNCSASTVGGGTIRAYLYKEHCVEGGLQYNYTTSDIDLLAGVKYIWERCDVIHDPTKQEPMGRTITSRIKANFGLRAAKHWADVNLAYNHTNGIEHVKIYDTSPGVNGYVIQASNVMSTYDIIRADAEYRFMPRGKEGPWAFGVNAKYYLESDEYVAPQSTLNGSFVRGGLCADRKIDIGKTMLEIYLEAGFRAGLAGEYIFTSTITSPKLQAIKDDFYPSIAAYYKAHAADVSLRLAYDIPIKKSSIRIIASGAFAKPINISGNRFGVHLGVEYRF